jgi:hypothetical protein
MISDERNQTFNELLKSLIKSVAADMRESTKAGQCPEQDLPLPLDQSGKCRRRRCPPANESAQDKNPTAEATADQNQDLGPPLITWGLFDPGEPKFHC